MKRNIVKTLALLLLLIPSLGFARPHKKTNRYIRIHYKNHAPIEAKSIGGRHVADDSNPSLLSGTVCFVDGKTQVDLSFSSPIDPRSIEKSSLFINGNKVDPSPRYGFNRNGTTLRFQTEIKPPFTVAIKNLKNITGITFPDKAINIE